MHASRRLALRGSRRKPLARSLPLRPRTTIGLPRMKNTRVITIRVFGGPLDGLTVTAQSVDRLPPVLTKTIPVNHRCNHLTTYKLQVFQMPDGTMDYAYIATTVTAVERPAK